MIIIIIMDKALKIFRRLLVILIISLSPSLAFSQDLDAHSPRPNQGSHQQRKADAKKEKQKKKLDKAIDKGKKRHLKIQEKETRKMMRRSKKKAKKWNNN